MKYEKLSQRRDYLNKLTDEVDDTNALMEMDCIDHFFECEEYKTYGKILRFAENNGFKRVFDIGCAYGHQSEVFINSKVDYIGINEDECDYWNKDRYKYISKHYPFEIKANANDLAVSVLCLTWNCYLYEKDKTLKEQCEALSRDFRNCLLYMQINQLEFVKKYFKNCKIIDKNLVYLGCDKNI